MILRLDIGDRIYLPIHVSNLSSNIYSTILFHSFVFRKWAQQTFDHIVKLINEPDDYGALWQSGYEMTQNKPIERPFWADTVRNYRLVGCDELARMGFADFK